MTLMATPSTNVVAANGTSPCNLRCLFFKTHRMIMMGGIMTVSAVPYVAPPIAQTATRLVTTRDTMERVARSPTVTLSDTLSVRFTRIPVLTTQSMTQPVHQKMLASWCTTTAFCLFRYCKFGQFHFPGTAPLVWDRTRNLEIPNPRLSLFFASHGFVLTRRINRQQHTRQKNALTIPQLHAEDMPRFLPSWGTNRVWYLRSETLIHPARTVVLRIRKLRPG
jgi:hypothetical protein